MCFDTESIINEYRKLHPDYDPFDQYGSYDEWKFFYENEVFHFDELEVSPKGGDFVG